MAERAKPYISAPYRQSRVFETRCKPMIVSIPEHVIAWIHAKRQMAPQVIIGGRPRSMSFSRMLSHMLVELYDIETVNDLPDIKEDRL